MENKRILLIIVTIVILCFVLACGSSTATIEGGKPAEELKATRAFTEPPIRATSSGTIHLPKTDTPIPEPTDTTIPIPSDSPLPAPTTWLGVIDCPECEGIPLWLWADIDDKGRSQGTVNHGDICIVLDQGIARGIEKYKLDCDGMIGWLRSEGIIPAE